MERVCKTGTRDCTVDMCRIGGEGGVEWMNVFRVKFNIYLSDSRELHIIRVEIKLKTGRGISNQLSRV